jgi:uncharacterized membrane protein YadS
MASGPTRRDNTAEATAAGALYSDAAAKLAVLTKTTRNAPIGFVVLAYAIYWASRGQAETIGNKAAFLWQKFPKFVLGFLLISALATQASSPRDNNLALAIFSAGRFFLPSPASACAPISARCARPSSFRGRLYRAKSPSPPSPCSW